eukprot:TRINITY_DN74063_c0_g1_i7.p1 TRINITY_DN74063_c0_g1~~TRINITY_DN74063_c0_g1_i7.p1  ORF type:complete len:205 (-),score=14.26 TRINITY_DN74063_c0_g1_i7:424-1038(-)
MHAAHGSSVYRLIRMTSICLFALAVIQRTVCVYIDDSKDSLFIQENSNCKYTPQIVYYLTDVVGDSFTSGRDPVQVQHRHRRLTRKRGRRAGALVRFRRRSLRPPLPAIVLANVQSVRNKTDELFYLLGFKREFKDASVVCLTETWLEPSIPDSAIPPPGYSLLKADRSRELSGEERDGGVCFMINQRWCSDTKLVSQSCSPEL